MQKAFVGRQPIFREGVDLFAYELFSQNHQLDRPAFVHGDSATASVLLDEFIDVALERVVGPHPAFVDVTRDFIVSDYSATVPKHGVVLQVAANGPADDEFVGALSRLSRAGHSIALDNFVYRDELRPLAEVADVVKLNVRQFDEDAMCRQMEAVRPLQVKTLAKDVETYHDYQRCKDLGFDYFQGFFFCKPQISNRDGLPHNRASMLHLLSRLQDPDISLDELEHAVGQDVAMSYRILRYLNSPINAFPRRIDSIRHAISLVGISLIRQWASVIWLESIEDKPRELMTMSMIRAHMCEQLAAAMYCKNTDQFFTVGLLSLLDALLDRPMPAILNDLPLVDPVKDALLERRGRLGVALKCAEAYERCDWDQVRCGNLDERKICEAYLTSVAWSRAITQDLVN
jgi:EAL and modified HD-GYP domain-containing signal transduction protein